MSSGTQFNKFTPNTQRVYGIAQGDYNLHDSYIPVNGLPYYLDGGMDARIAKAGLIPVHMNLQGLYMKYQIPSRSVAYNAKWKFL